jgi:hypothetical protein
MKTNNNELSKSVHSSYMYVINPSVKPGYPYACITGIHIHSVVVSSTCYQYNVKDLVQNSIYICLVNKTIGSGKRTGSIAQPMAEAYGI